MKTHRAASFDASSNEIAKTIARYRASGLGLKAFALEAGLPPGRLHYWIYQKSGVTGRGPTQPTPTAAAAVFQEVKLPSQPEWGKRLSCDGLFSRAEDDRMTGWPRAGGISGCLFEDGLTGLLPLERRQLIDLPIGGVR